MGFGTLVETWVLLTTLCVVEAVYKKIFNLNPYDQNILGLKYKNLVFKIKANFLVAMSKKQGENAVYMRCIRFSFHRARVGIG